MAYDSVFTYDLLGRLRRDPKKAKMVNEALQNVASINKAVSEGKATKAELSAAQGKLVPICGFNFGLLIPIFFPRYPKEEPLNFLNRPFMFAMTCLGPDSVVVLKAGRQAGKCVTADTRVTARIGGHVTECSMSDLFDYAANTEV
jgi:hypothetical protein